MRSKCQKYLIASFRAEFSTSGFSVRAAGSSLRHRIGHPSSPHPTTPLHTKPQRPYSNAWREYSLGTFWGSLASKTSARGTERGRANLIMPLMEIFSPAILSISSLARCFDPTRVAILIILKRATARPRHALRLSRASHHRKTCFDARRSVLETVARDTKDHVFGPAVCRESFTHHNMTVYHRDVAASRRTKTILQRTRAVWLGTVGHGPSFPFAPLEAMAKVEGGGGRVARPVARRTSTPLGPT